MSKGLVSPYTAPDFYADALAKGRHRDIVGGRWDETGRAQMQLLRDVGLQPHHHLLDIGAGSLRLGCKAVPYLDAGNYWATDASRALMLAGQTQELDDPARLPTDHLVEDTGFAFPAIPDTITHAIAFAVFTHLPMNHLRVALLSLRARFPALETLLFTVFLAPDPAALLHPVKQPDGVVTHATRAPWHMLADDVLHLTRASGFTAKLRADRLPRGQALVIAHPA